MSLFQKIKTDALEARRNRATNEAAASLLVTLQAEAAMVGKNKGNREPTDSEVVGVVRKFLSNAQDTLKALDAADPRAQTAQAEIALLNGYLPAQLSEEALTDVVNKIIAALGCVRTKKNMGLVMKELKAHYDGTYDGALANKIVSAALDQ